MSFVVPRVERIVISGGRWIEIKRELNAGENRRMFARQIRDYSPTDGRAQYDPEQVGFARIVAYLLSWSFDQHGERVPVTEAAIDALDQSTYAEILTAIDRHEARVDTERTAEKNGQAGENRSAATSLSVA